MTVAKSTLRDAFADLRTLTPARIGLGRCGQGLPTGALLEFQLAHARARDVIHTPLDTERVRRSIPLPTIVVQSQAPDRTAYLQDPRLGRRRDANASGLVKGGYDLALVVADGLSASAVHANAAGVVDGLARRLGGWKLAPVVIALQARVAIGDDIGEALGARAVVVLIGERPGLSSADSLSAYITWAPKTGRRDNERNCVSNIRSPAGLGWDAAADKVVALLSEARRLGFSGVNLKDRQSGVGEAWGAQIFGAVSPAAGGTADVDEAKRDVPDLPVAGRRSPPANVR